MEQPHVDMDFQPADLAEPSTSPPPSSSPVSSRQSTATPVKAPAEKPTEQPPTALETKQQEPQDPDTVTVPPSHSPSLTQEVPEASKNQQPVQDSEPVPDWHTASAPANPSPTLSDNKAPSEPGEIHTDDEISVHGDQDASATDLELFPDNPPSYLQSVQKTSVLDLDAAPRCGLYSASAWDQPAIEPTLPSASKRQYERAEEREHVWHSSHPTQNRASSRQDHRDQPGLSSPSRIDTNKDHRRPWTSRPPLSSLNDRNVSYLNPSNSHRRQQESSWESGHKSAWDGPVPTRKHASWGDDPSSAWENPPSTQTDDSWGPSSNTWADSDSSATLIKQNSADISEKAPYSPSTQSKTPLYARSASVALPPSLSHGQKETSAWGIPLDTSSTASEGADRHGWSRNETTSKLPLSDRPQQQPPSPATNRLNRPPVTVNLQTERPKSDTRRSGASAWDLPVRPTESGWGLPEDNSSWGTPSGAEPHSMQSHKRNLQENASHRSSTAPRKMISNGFNSPIRHTAATSSSRSNGWGEPEGLKGHSGPRHSSMGDANGSFHQSWSDSRPSPAVQDDAWSHQQSPRSSGPSQQRIHNGWDQLQDTWGSTETHSPLLQGRQDSMGARENETSPRHPGPTGAPFQLRRQEQVSTSAWDDDSKVHSFEAGAAPLQESDFGGSGWENSNMQIDGWGTSSGRASGWNVDSSSAWNMSSTEGGWAQESSNNSWNTAQPILQPPPSTWNAPTQTSDSATKGLASHTTASPSIPTSGLQPLAKSKERPAPRKSALKALDKVEPRPSRLPHFRTGPDDLIPVTWPRRQRSDDEKARQRVSVATKLKEKKRKAKEKAQIKKAASTAKASEASSSKLSRRSSTRKRTRINEDLALESDGHDDDDDPRPSASNALMRVPKPKRKRKISVEPPRMPSESEGDDPLFPNDFEPEPTSSKAVAVAQTPPEDAGKTEDDIMTEVIDRHIHEHDWEHIIERITTAEIHPKGRKLQFFIEWFDFSLTSLHS